MTDAREIIAQEFRQAHRDTCYPDATTGECEIAASVIVASLTAAGFRIIGKDEVDQVTVDKCAAEVKLLRQLLHSQTITLDVGREDMAYFLAEDAIRAIGRKA